MDIKRVNYQSTQLNQYHLALASANFIRKNPESQHVKEIKACKTQAALSDVFRGMLDAKAISTIEE